MNKTYGKRKLAKPLTVGDVYKEHGVTKIGEDEDLDMPVSVWFEKQNMPKAASLFKYLFG